FDRFRYVFNNERPHEALNNQMPASIYYPSGVRFPRKIADFKYPKNFQIRRVNNSGDISWHKNRVFISEVFRFEELGLELSQPGLYRFTFGSWRSANLMWRSFVFVQHAELFEHRCRVI